MNYVRAFLDCIKLLPMYQDYHPNTGLRELVDLFFSIRRTASEQSKSTVDLIVPDGTLGLLFVHQGNLQRSSLRGNTQLLDQTYFFGQKTKSVYYEFNPDALDVFGVKLKAGALMKLFGLSPGELTDSLIPAHAVLGHKLKELQVQLSATSETLSRKEILESFLLQLQAQRNRNDKDRLLDAILNYVNQVRGNISVAELASHFQVGYKQLERLFKVYTGLTPKQFCRIIRFNATLYYQQQRQVETLTDLAYCAGYFDQMHFIKEVKNITDLSPSQFYKKIGQGIAPQQRQHIANKYA